MNGVHGFAKARCTEVKTCEVAKRVNVEHARWRSMARAVSQIEDARMLDPTKLRKPGGAQVAGIVRCPVGGSQ